ncbi:MAG: hypothetical protein HN987_03540 [Proteobacteria bacterium]|jgi:hypothetical protein|nr:hypothetical protein [Pseudomonadota bacterium]
MSESTSISVGTEITVADFIPTYVSNNTPSAFRPKPRIKVQFPTEFPLMTVPPSSMKRLELAMGKSI